MTEGEAFAVALLVQLGMLPAKPIIGNAIWLLNRWKSMSFLHRYMYSALVRKISVLTVHSSACLPVAREVFPLSRCELMYFGINESMFSGAGSEEVLAEQVTRILAVGNDRTRDWDTLLAAVGNDERFRVTIVCWWIPDRVSEIYENVRVVRFPEMGKFLEYYKNADIVAIPMVENLFSGITVALEAAALERPILSSFTGGVPTYFNEDEVFYVRVGDTEGMRDTLLSASPEERRERAAKAHRRFRASDYTTRAMIRRYAALTREQL
jgi:glycosyltransferase involved in cell wall biosynthesis